MHYTQSDKHCGEDLYKKIINATSQIRKGGRKKKKICIYSIASACHKLPDNCSLMIPSKFLKMVICHPVSSFVT